MCVWKQAITDNQHGKKCAYSRKCPPVGMQTISSSGIVNSLSEHTVHTVSSLLLTTLVKGQ